MAKANLSAARKRDAQRDPVLEALANARPSTEEASPMERAMVELAKAEKGRGIPHAELKRRLDIK